MFSIFFNSCFCLVFASITIVVVRHFYILDPDPHPPSFPDGIMRFHVDPDPHPPSFHDGILRFHVDPDYCGSRLACNVLLFDFVFVFLAFLGKI